jgi:hypothetical protein
VAAAAVEANGLFEDMASLKNRPVEPRRTE